MIDLARSARRFLGVFGVLLFGLQPSGAAEPHAYMPGDAKLVFVVRFSRLLDAPLVSREKPVTVRALLQKDPEIQDIHGVKPLEDVTTITVALPSVGEVSKVFIVIEGRFDPPAIRERLARDFKDSIKEYGSGTATFQGFKAPVRTFHGIHTPEDAYVAVPDKGLCLISVGSRSDLETALGARKAGTPAELRALLDKANKQHVLSYALLSDLKGPFADLPQLKRVFARFQSISGGVWIDEEVSGQFVAEAPGEEAARELEEVMRSGLNTLTGGVALLAGTRRQLQPLLAVLKTLRVRRQDRQITVKGKLERDVLEEMLMAEK